MEFTPGSSLPAHFTYWRPPIADSYTISAPGHPNTLELKPSRLNLTGVNANYAGTAGQTFVGRRQQDTLFTFSVGLDYSPVTLEEEAGVSVFLVQNHHLEMGIVMLPANASTLAFPCSNMAKPADHSKLIPQIRFRGISTTRLPEPVVMPLPIDWIGETMNLEIKASNTTHYSFSIGAQNTTSKPQTIAIVSNAAVSWGFTGKKASIPQTLF